MIQKTLFQKAKEEWGERKKEGKMYNQVLNVLILGNDSEGICSKGSGNTATDFMQSFAVNAELASRGPSKK